MPGVLGGEGFGDQHRRTRYQALERRQRRLPALKTRQRYVSLYYFPISVEGQ